MGSSENYPPVGEVAGKRQAVETMFDTIAPRYDLLNRVLSLGIDQSWRRKAVRLLEPYAPKEILDVATGTADLAILAAGLRPDRIVGVDIANQMLEIGRKKVASENLDGLIELRHGDASSLPFDDATFDAAMVAFGVRNFEDLKGGLREIARVLRPGGRLVVLEFSRPRSFPARQLSDLYMLRILPRIGRMVSGDSGAYRYLPASVSVFPDGQDFLRLMRESGFSEPSETRLTLGIASLYVGKITSGRPL